MTTQLTDVEFDFDAALAAIAADQEIWFAAQRRELAAKVAQIRRETEARVRMVNAVWRRHRESERVPESMIG